MEVFTAGRETYTVESLTDREMNMCASLKKTLLNAAESLVFTAVKKSLSTVITCWVSVWAATRVVMDSNMRVKRSGKVKGGFIYRFLMKVVILWGFNHPSSGHPSLKKEGS